MKSPTAVNYNPKYMEDTFVCPNCGTQSLHEWFECVAGGREEFKVLGLAEIVSRSQNAKLIVDNLSDIKSPWSVSRCIGCSYELLWDNREPAYPETLPVEEPHSDMPSEVKALYYEAASILTRSPRAAAALIRLALETLLKAVGKHNGKLDSSIAELLRSEGFTEDDLKPFDLIRLVGNSSVHPVQVILESTREDANNLFWLLNYIADTTYTRLAAKARIHEMHNKLPVADKKNIADRNRGHTPKGNT